MHVKLVSLALSRGCMAVPLVACPGNSNGDDVADGCVCNAGFEGGGRCSCYCLAVSCPEHSSGRDVPHGCSCHPGFEGDITATSVPPFFDGYCLAVSCPEHSSGRDVPHGCSCHPGYEGDITATSVQPFFDGYCLAVSCPEHSSGRDVPHGCSCHPGYNGTITASSRDPFYTGMCLNSAGVSPHRLAPLPEGVSYGQWLGVYNALSFGIASMGAATIFFWLQIPNVNRKFRTALTITGLVTAIACYHYVRIFNSWVGAFAVAADSDGNFQVSPSGQPFNDAYRYVDWLLTVPLLLIELILVMGLPTDQTRSLSWTLGLSSALMVALGYPGEIQEDPQARWLWWGLSMLPFCFVLFQLLVGLGAATQTQPEAARGLIGHARMLTAASWLTYPGVYVVKMMGISGATAMVAEQIGYSVADVVAKAVFGVLIWAIAAAKSDYEKLFGEAVVLDTRVEEEEETP